jgi:hypothetical protein
MVLSQRRELTLGLRVPTGFNLLPLKIISRWLELNGYPVDPPAILHCTGAGSVKWGQFGHELPTSGAGDRVHLIELLVRGEQAMTRWRRALNAFTGPSDGDENSSLESAIHGRPQADPQTWSVDQKERWSAALARHWVSSHDALRSWRPAAGFRADYQYFMRRLCSAAKKGCAVLGHGSPHVLDGPLAPVAAQWQR